MLKILNASVAAIIPDESQRAAICQLLGNTPAVDNHGGMTLDYGTGPIVVAHGKPSLADEKALRESIREYNAKAKLSRTNNITQRCADYKVADNAKSYAKLFGPKEATTGETVKKRGRKAKDMAVADVQVDTVPAIDVLRDDVPVDESVTV